MNDCLRASGSPRTGSGIHDHVDQPCHYRIVSDSLLVTAYSESCGHGGAPDSI